jgi:5'(3')-deoxyribonucleotidase
MNKPVIMFDVDGVLANFNGGYRKLLNKTFALDVSLDKPAFWDDLPEGVTPAMDQEVWRIINKSEKFWLDLDPFVDREERARISRMSNGYMMYFVTARGGIEPKKQTEAWLRYHVGITDPTVIVSNRKSEAANALRANYAIDDKAGNVLQIYYNAPKTKAFIYDAPYNQYDHRVIGRRTIRVKTVTEFLDHVEGR